MREELRTVSNLIGKGLVNSKSFDKLVDDAKKRDNLSLESEVFVIGFCIKIEHLAFKSVATQDEANLVYIAALNPYYRESVYNLGAKFKTAVNEIVNYKEEEYACMSKDLIDYIENRLAKLCQVYINKIKDKYPQIFGAPIYSEEVLDAAKKIVAAKALEEEKLHADVIEATATPVEDQNAVAAYLPEGKEIVKRGRKPKEKENIKDAEIVEEAKAVQKEEQPKAVPKTTVAQPNQATVPPVPMPEKKGGYFDQVKQPDVFKVTLDPNNPSITFIPAEQQPQPKQATPVVQPPVQQTQSDMPNLNNLIQPEEPVKDQKTFIGPKVKIVEDKPVEEFGLKPDVKVTTPPSQQIIDPPMPQPVNPQYASIPNMGNFKVVPPETNVNTGINNPILLFKENIGEVGFILTFGNYVVPKEIFTRLDYSNLVNTQFDCGIILCDITAIFGNPETYRMIKDITKNDYLPMFRYVGNNPSGRAVFYSEQVNGKTVRIEVIENNGTANISVKAI